MDFRNVIGKITGALTGIILIEVGWPLRMVMVVEQAAKRGLTNFVALAQQTIAVSAKKQTDCLQQQNSECDGWQLSFDFSDYHLWIFIQVIQNFEKYKANQSEMQTLNSTGIGHASRSAAEYQHVRCLDRV